MSKHTFRHVPRGHQAHHGGKIAAQRFARTRQAMLIDAPPRKPRVSLRKLEARLLDADVDVDDAVPDISAFLIRKKNRGDV